MYLFIYTIISYAIGKRGNCGRGMLKAHQYISIRSSEVTGGGYYFGNNELVKSKE
jgi:hypothetical protein